MKVSFQFHSLFVNIMTALFHSIVFNSACIVVFGLIYFFVATKKMPFDEYFILSTKTQFLIPDPNNDESSYDHVEKDVIFIQKLLVVIGLAVIGGRFFVNLLK